MPPSELDLRTLEIDESDPNAGISDLESRRAAFIQDLVVVSSYAPDRRRFIAIAPRGSSSSRSLPPEWHEAWLWGYRWQPEPTASEKTGSRAVLDAVSPTTRAGMLESLSELGVTPPMTDTLPPLAKDTRVVWRNLSFERQSPGVWLTADRLWKLQNAGGEPHWIAFLQLNPYHPIVDSAPTAAEALDRLLVRAKDLGFKLWAALDPVSDP